jgi:large subunit ribosomal protein L17
MRHGNSLRKLGRSVPHRRALFRNLATDLFLHGRIKTTLPKAKELKRIADKLVTLGKRGDLHARRKALAYLNAINRESAGNANKTTAVHNLFTDIAERFRERNGGYTRVLKLGTRPGDGAEMAIIEFVEKEFSVRGRKRRRVYVAAEQAAVVNDGIVAATV